MTSEYRQQIKKRTLVKIKIEPKNTMTEIPGNMLERHLLSSLKPFNLMQTVFVASKYKIKNGYITSNGVCYDIISFFGSLIFINAFIYCRLIRDFNYRNVGHIITFSFGYFVNWYFNTTLKQKNILLVNKIQKLCRSLTFDASFFNRFTFHNWTCVIGVNMYYILLICHLTYVFGFSVIYLAMCFYCYVIFDINMSYATAVVKFLCISLERWLEHVQKTGYSEKWIQDFIWDKLLDDYLDILDVYQLTENTLGPHVCFIIYIV